MRKLRPGDNAQRTRVVTKRDIELFSEMSGDYNPLHYDRQYAEATRFGGIIVQGGVTSALLNAVVAEDLPGPGSVFLNLNLDFTAPVAPGDTITARVEVTEVREDKPITKLSCEITKNDGETVLEGNLVVWTENPTQQPLSTIT